MVEDQTGAFDKVRNCKFEETKGTPTAAKKTWQKIKDNNEDIVPIKYSELYSTHIENLIRAENNMPLREYYANDPGADGQNASTLLINARTGRSLYVNGDGMTNFTRLRGKEKGYKYNKK